MTWLLHNRGEKIHPVGDDAIDAQLDEPFGRIFVIDGVAEGGHAFFVDFKRFTP